MIQLAHQKSLGPEINLPSLHLTDDVFIFLCQKLFTTLQ